MLSFKEVAEEAITACTDLVQIVPSRNRVAAEVVIQDLRTKLANAVEPPTSSHMTRIWQKYREDLRFTVAQFIAGSDEKCGEDRIVTGYAELASLTHLSESTLRQKMSLGHGTITRLAKNPDGSPMRTQNYQNIQLVITRINPH
jgi:plasmid stabilization system protein ParE